MYISNETTDQTERRLLRVIAEAEFQVFERHYVFEEFPLHNFHADISDNALAFIRDEEVWSQLVPSEDKTRELFTLIGFHFKPNMDNSGFVGWLATHLKQKLGTGVFVVCGQNSGRGGIYDYWGCPAEIGDEFIAEVRLLIAKGKQL